MKIIRKFLLKWLREDVIKELKQNFNKTVTELKDGNTANFVFHLQGGGNSYQRRKQKRLIMRNMIANFYNYS